MKSEGDKQLLQEFRNNNKKDIVKSTNCSQLMKSGESKTNYCLNP